MKKDFEYIKNKFDNDDISTPESLSEDRIAEMLTDEQTSSVYARRPPVMRYVALAACAVIAVAGIRSLNYSDLLLPDTSVKSGELYTFKNKSEIVRLVKSMNKSGIMERFRMKSYDTTTELAMEEDTGTSEAVVDSYNAAITSNSGDSNHSTTYLQVDSVDEADIVKTDGKYIYVVNNKQEVVIFEAAGGIAKRTSTIGSEGIENYISDIFLKDDTLITIGRIYDDNGDSSVAVVTYDITDRSKPEVLGEFRQSGQNIVSSRMIGDFVYLVTNTYAYKESPLPKCTIDGDYVEMPAADISCVPGPSNSYYTILSAIDIASGTSHSKTKAVFGSSDIIYCNNNNLYIAIEEYNKKTMDNETRILRASLDGLKIKFNATANVNGYINNQFSMDEHNGYFRIATTSLRSGLNVNNLYVLDSDLKESGKIAGFARDESIKAVRFMGEKAYVITYEAIDPLFVIDLKDPEDPHIEGEVKIDGFSSMLVPIGSNRILGIGLATGDNGYGGQYETGLKLALFDVSDPLEPKVLDSKEFKDMSSPSQDTHLALCVNNSKGYYAIPYDVYSSGNRLIIEDELSEEGDSREISEDEHGVLVFGTDDVASNIEVFDRHKFGISPMMRCVYIGDYIYGISSQAEIEGFRYPEENTETMQN